MEKQRTYTIALVQMVCEYLDLEKNLGKAEKAIREAAAKGAKLIVLPEAFNTGYYGGDLREVTALAEDENGPTYTRIASLARENGIFVMAPFFTKDENGIFNSALLFDDQGKELGRYSKSHLIGSENELIRRGGKYPVWDTPLGKIGCLICYDVCFSETVRVLALSGAEVVLVPSAWRASHYFTQWWDLNVACRALDNLLYIAAVNQIGPSGSENFAGHTKLADPIGHVEVGADDVQETVLYGVINLDRIEKERAFNTVLKDRHPEDYGLIVH